MSFDSDSTYGQVEAQGAGGRTDYIMGDNKSSSEARAKLSSHVTVYVEQEYPT